MFIDKLELFTIDVHVPIKAVLSTSIPARKKIIAVLYLQHVMFSFVNQLPVLEIS